MALHNTSLIRCVIKNNFIEDLDEKVLYKGWLPINDELDDSIDHEPRLYLESFIKLYIEHKRRRKKKIWNIDGSMSTGPDNPGFDSSEV
jgi:hypothetical protein